MTITAWTLAMIYLLSGVGVMLALSDDDDKPLGLGGILIALFCVAIWPMFFTFALTSFLRSVSEQRPRDITVRPKEDQRTTTNRVG